MSRIRFVKGKIIKTTGGNYNMYSNGNIVTNAGGFINESAGNQIIYGAPEDPPRWKNPKIIEMQFLNENGRILRNENITKFNGIFATDFLYGKKLKIKFLTRDVKDGTRIEFKLKANSKDDYQDFFQIDKLSWDLEINNNTCETDFFTLNTLWYSENFEYYNYTLHRTEIKAEDLNTFSVKGKLDFKFFELPENRQDDLKPIAYLRNYEELIGLFNTDNSGQKALIDNYENKFINYNPEIFRIFREFSDYINSETLTLNDIKARVETDAKKLWETAVKGVQGGNLDDRPLYWARNKMQVRLKRNGLFANDIDFETSIVTKGSELDNMIKLFEEKSRNYTDIDFSKAGNKKKVLITGFDPFVLNSGKYSWADINTQNPSGISALNFHGKMIGNAYIQCAIVPVRYEDFDNGIIENIVQNNINQFDIMMTMSRNDSNFDIERFACKFRGGFFDNMNIGNDSEYVKMEYPNLKLGDWNKSRFKQIYSGNEFYETTLPIAKILVGDLAPSKKIVFFDQTVKDDAGFESKHPNKGGVPNTISKIFSSSSVTGKSIEHSGSGGDYLSNEIMYRATRKRDELGMQNIKGVGHIHINDSLDFKQVLNILTKIVTNATN